ncbi:fibronectin type III domain-containing protein [Chryseobacterium lacus]|uniref:fibronectin type III domain-containing protein n=1 Tax=Chryseobacterium lacus TaxID=2058346 RepID=UPI000F8808AC|nr:fibronectin type III domain-containing protein [Chryseobacterium lacus]RST25884.1 T9SS C-terminal target domain-containing protein [Chryseobacterium lacus]
MKNFYEKGLSYAVRQAYLKGILLAFFLLGLSSVKMQAQVSGYVFSQATGTYNSIASVGSVVTGSEASTSTTNDTTGWNVTIPFTFNFNGSDYTSLYVNSNGGVTFGSTTSNATTLISTSTAYEGAIAVMNRDLWGVFITSGVTTSGSNVITNVGHFHGMEVGKALNAVNGIPTGATVTAFDATAGTITMSAPATSSSAAAVVRYGTGKIFTHTEGTAPNRVFVIEWSGYNDYSTTVAGSNYMSFQLRLSETTNLVSIVYGDYLNYSTTSRTNQIGLRGVTNSDFNNRTGVLANPWTATAAGTANNSTVARDNVNYPPSGLTFTWTPPTCIAPSDVLLGSPTNNSVSATWTPSASALLGYSLYYSTVNTAPTSSTVLDGTNSVTVGAGATGAMISGLAPSTPYYVWIRSLCSASDTGQWVPVGNFTTLCTTFSTPFVQDFGSGSLPSCWTNQNAFSTNANALWKFSSDPGYGASPALNGRASGTFAWVDASATYAAMHNVELLSPMINLVGLTAPYVSFDWFKNHSTSSTTTTPSTYDDNMLKLDINDGNGWVNIFSSSTNAPVWRTEGIVLPASYNGATIQLRFTVDKDVAGNGYFYDDLLLDNVEVKDAPTCVPPTNVIVAAQTTTGATIDWTAAGITPANGYQLYYSDINAAPTSSTILDASNSVTATGVTVDITGLTPATVYYVWVRSNCGGGSFSDWTTAPVSFATLCVPFTALFEDFESYPTGSIVPQCWERIAAATGAGSQTINTTSPASGTKNIYQYASTSQTPVIVVLPEFSNVNAGTHWLRFKARVSSLPGALEVGYVTDPADANTFVNLTTLDITNTSYNDNYYTVVVPTWVSANVRLAIRNPADAKSYYWDDVYWEAIPSCYAPTDLVLNGATSSSLDISWSAPVGSPTPVQGYEYYYSQTNTPPTAATPASGTSSATSVSINGLTGDTVYYVWVRSVCSATDTSSWSPVLQATTGYCVPSVGTSTTYYLATMTTTGATVDLNYTASSYSPYVNNSATSVINAYPTQSFDIFLDGSGTSTYYYYVWVDWNNNMNFEDAGERIIAPTSTTYITSLSETLTIPAGTPYGSYRVRVGMSFSGAIDSSCGSGRSGNFVDLTLNIVAPPTCVAPTNIQVTNVTHNSATIGWDASITPPAMGYDIYYSATNTPPTATSVPQVQNAPGLSADITGLAPITTYYVWVRSHCSGTDQSVWTSVPVTVTTLCQPPAITGTTGAYVCNSSATLSATADVGATVRWYADATSTTALATGTSYTTPVLTATTNYYVSASTGSSGNVGPASPSALGTISATDYAISTYYQIFDVISPTTLVSIDVYPVSSVAIGTASAIEIRDSSGTTLISVPYTVTVNDGVTPQTVVLNYPLAVGTGYRIGQGVGINLNRNTSGAAYPYTSSNINITGNNFTSGSNYWYYIYNWIFSTACESARTVVTATYDCTLGTSETESIKEIQVYPNPFTDVINISDAKNLKSVTVMDASGRMVKTIANPGAQIHLGELKSGLYLLKLSYADGNTKTVKVIKR